MSKRQGMRLRLGLAGHMHGGGGGGGGGEEGGGGGEDP